MRDNRFSRMRRIICPGYPYFITNITFERQSFIVDNIDLIWESFRSVRRKLFFDPITWVFLPEHFHLLVNPEDGEISSFMQRLKLSFSMNYRKRCGYSQGLVWQHRFWDHIIRDEKDYERHVNYIHINPVKHGLVKRAFDWPYSSIHKFKDCYPEDWGEGLEFEGDFGE